MVLLIMPFRPPSAAFREERWRHFVRNFTNFFLSLLDPLQSKLTNARTSKRYVTDATTKKKSPVPFSPVYAALPTALNADGSVATADIAFNVQKCVCHYFPLSHLFRVVLPLQVRPQGNTNEQHFFSVPCAFQWPSIPHLPKIPSTLLTDAT